MFSVDGRMFCVLCGRGPHAGSVSFKVDAHRFSELTGQPGIAPAPCLARAHWVQLPRPRGVSEADIRAFVRRSYGLVRAKLSKRRQKELAD